MLVVATELRPSPIHGLGVCALAPLQAGEVVSRFLPPLDVQFTADLLRCLEPVELEYLRRYAYRNRFSGLYILPGDHDRFMNHSESPNVGMNPNGSLTCIALRPIAAGEELTCDYRTFDLDWPIKLAPPCNS
jgi:SET domain-containing protein